VTGNADEREELDSDLKFARAKELLGNLERAKREYLGREPFQISFESDSVEWIWRLNVSALPPAELVLICGDLIQNLRSSLDYRVMTLASRVLAVPLSKRQKRDLAFPAIGGEANFENRVGDWVELLPPMGAEIVESVRVFQPFATPSGYLDFLGEEDEIKREQAATFERLHRLKWLSDKDKHERLHSLGVSFAGSSFHGISMPANFRRRPNPIMHGAIITTLPIEAAPNLSHKQVRLKLELRLHRPYSEYEPTPTEGSFDFVSELENISTYVSKALEILEYEENRILAR
jgi:hypothetical protein